MAATTPIAPPLCFLINSSTKQFLCINSPISLKNTSSCFLNTFNSTSVPNYTSTWTIKKNGQTILTSNETNPTITLNQVGVYSITLTATNNFGSNTITKNNIIEIINTEDDLYCAPMTTNIGSYLSTIHKVKFGSIENLTPNNSNEGYRDFSCSKIGVLSP